MRNFSGGPHGTGKRERRPVHYRLQHPERSSRKPNYRDPRNRSPGSIIPGSREELISTCVTPTRVKTIQRVPAQQDAKRHLCALRLLKHFFTKEELAESNTDGSHDKRGLDSGKLNSLKILVFSKFPASNSEEKAKAWRLIKGKINSKCRVPRKSLKSTPPRSL